MVLAALLFLIIMAATVQLLFVTWYLGPTKISVQLSCGVETSSGYCETAAPKQAFA